MSRESKPTENAQGAVQATGSSDADTRIAPDPFIVVLPALSALAAVTSIAAVNWVAQDKTPDRSKTRRKPAAALRDLESCCLGLQEIFRRFLRNPRLFAGSQAAAAPLKFGVHGTRVTPDEARVFYQLMNDTASMLVLSAQNAADVMAAVEDGDITPPEDVFFALGAAQDDLNQIIQQRLPLKQAVETGALIAKRLTDVVRMIKAERPV
ncbi:MAG: hypothetical protein ACFCUN_06495 [Hyphomicrobiaceae bacterium]